MEKTTFQLPNEVPSQTTSNGFDHTNMTTSEYKKVTTTSSLAKHNHLPSTNLQFNTFEATMVKQATTQERLKWLGVILTVSIVINTATFTGLTASLMERMNKNEQTSENYYSNTEALLSRSPINNMTTSAAATDIETRLHRLELNLTQHRTDTETTLLNLESNQIQDRLDTERKITTVASNQNQQFVEFQENITIFIDSIASNLTRNKEAILENSQRLSEIYNKPKGREQNITETDVGFSERLDIIENYMGTEQKTFSNLSAIVSELITWSNTEFVTINEFTNETRYIWAYIEAENSTIKANTDELLQIKNDLDSVKAETNNHSSKIIQIETERVTDRGLFELLSDRVSQQGTEVASQNATIETLNEDISDNRNGLTQLQTDILAQNMTIESARNRIDHIETDITEVQDNISFHATAIMQAQASLSEHNASLHMNELRIDELESKGTRKQHLIANLTMRLGELETDQNITNTIIQDLTFFNQGQTAEILELQMRMNETRNKIEEHDTLLSNAKAKVAFSLRQENSMENVQIGDIIKYHTVLLNEGSGYDLNTGEFTAPVSGVYQFSYFISHLYNPPSQAWARLVVDGVVINAAVVDAFHEGQDIQGGNVGIARLNAGDKAWIESWWRNDAFFDAGYGFSTFSGIFVYE